MPHHENTWICSSPLGVKFFCKFLYKQTSLTNNYSPSLSFQKSTVSTFRFEGGRNLHVIVRTRSSTHVINIQFKCFLWGWFSYPYVFLIEIFEFNYSVSEEPTSGKSLLWQIPVVFRCHRAPYCAVKATNTCKHHWEFGAVQKLYLAEIQNVWLPTFPSTCLVTHPPMQVWASPLPWSNRITKLHDAEKSYFILTKDCSFFLATLFALVVPACSVGFWTHVCDL